MRDKLISGRSRCAYLQRGGISVQLRIRGAAAAVGVSPQTIRKWERQGLIRCPRYPNGVRYFMAADIERLRMLKAVLGRGTRIAAVRQLVATAEGQDQPPTELAATLRSLRAAQAYREEDVAAGAGLSVGYLRALENGLGNGTIEVLQRLATFYGVALIDLVRGGAGVDPEVLRVEDRPRLVTAGDHITIEGLAQGDVALRPMLLTVDPGAGAEQFHSHAGEEFIYVLSGHLWIELADHREYSLGPGDSAAFRSEVPHRWKAVDGILRALWVHRDTERTRTGDAADQKGDHA
jgi:DNA-binding transcriptional MerR regulator/mannose-6-phosphate isomerase-like protein (cupin superfamily)